MRTLASLIERNPPSRIILTRNIVKSLAKIINFQEMDSVFLATLIVVLVRIHLLAVFLAKMR